MENYLMDDVEFILASGSPRRRELFEALHLPFRALPVDADEHALPAEPCDRLVTRLAKLKAQTCADSLQGGDRARYSGGSLLIVAADTLVVIGGEILGKPQDAADAARMLRLLSGGEHEVYTAVCVSGGAKTTCRCVRTAVRFRQLSDSIIAGYVATGEPMDKAGAYGIQALGGVLTEGITGDYFNVMGLPVGELAALLRDEWGIDVLKWAKKM